MFKSELEKLKNTKIENMTVGELLKINNSKKEVKELKK